MHPWNGVNDDCSLVLLSFDDRLCRCLAFHCNYVFAVRDQHHVSAVFVLHEAPYPPRDALTAYVLHGHPAYASQDEDELHYKIVIEGCELECNLRVVQTVFSKLFVRELRKRLGDLEFAFPQNRRADLVKCHVAVLLSEGVDLDRPVEEESVEVYVDCASQKVDPSPWFYGNLPSREAQPLRPVEKIPEVKVVSVESEDEGIIIQSLKDSREKVPLRVVELNRHIRRQVQASLLYLFAFTSEEQNPLLTVGARE